MPDSKGRDNIVQYLALTSPNIATPKFLTRLLIHHNPFRDFNKYGEDIDSALDNDHQKTTRTMGRMIRHLATDTAGKAQSVEYGLSNYVDAIRAVRNSSNFKPEHVDHILGVADHIKEAATIEAWGGNRPETSTEDKDKIAKEGKKVSDGIIDALTNPATMNQSIENHFRKVFKPHHIDRFVNDHVEMMEDQRKNPMKSVDYESSPVYRIMERTPELLQPHHIEKIFNSYIGNRK
jgi:hypothetical protein